MKRQLIFLILISGVLISSKELSACHYTFDSKVKQVEIGEVFDVKVTVIYEHRRCVIDLDDTQFFLKGLDWVEQGEWVTEDRATYSKVLTLRPVKEGKAILEVVRECSKKGISSSEWGIKVISSDPKPTSKILSMGN